MPLEIMNAYQFLLVASVVCSGATLVLLQAVSRTRISCLLQVVHLPAPVQKTASLEIANPGRQLTVF